MTTDYNSTLHALAHIYDCKSKNLEALSSFYECSKILFLFIILFLHILHFVYTLSKLLGKNSSLHTCMHKAKLKSDKCSKPFQINFIQHSGSLIKQNLILFALKHNSKGTTINLKPHTHTKMGIIQINECEVSIFHACFFSSGPLLHCCVLLGTFFTKSQISFELISSALLQSLEMFFFLCMETNFLKRR